MRKLIEEAIQLFDNETKSFNELYEGKENLFDDVENIDPKFTKRFKLFESIYEKTTLKQLRENEDFSCLRCGADMDPNDDECEVCGWREGEDPDETDDLYDEDGDPITDEDFDISTGMEDDYPDEGHLKFSHDDPTVMLDDTDWDYDEDDDLERTMTDDDLQVVDWPTKEEDEKAATERAKMFNDIYGEK